MFYTIFILRRTATLVASKPSFLMSLSREAYNELLLKVHMNKKMEQIMFLEKLPFLQNIDESFTINSLYNSEIIHASYRYIVYKENDLVKSIYFLK